ncbi:MAG: hypothetical protein O9254_00900 [Rhodobacteraceae bacterium]|jgi:hypothetical protein|nr:hypothetical protein [Paracoccaceae bacterium]
MSNPDTATEPPPTPRPGDGLREYAGETGNVLGAVYEGLSRITSDPDFGKVLSRLGGVAGIGFGAWERAGDAEGITAKDAALGENVCPAGRFKRHALQAARHLGNVGQ